MADSAPGRGLVVGLTGGIACGKSEAGRILAESGAVVTDADEVAHRLMEPGQPVYAQVVEAFGHEVLDAHGRIDRGVLARRVFRDAAARAKLNGLVHPAVMRALDAWAGKIRATGAHGVALVPLLFEVGGTERWDVVVCVVAPKETVLARLAARGLGPAEAQARLDAQWSMEEKRKHADYVIENNASLASFRERVLQTWRTLLEKETGTHG